MNIPPSKTLEQAVRPGLLRVLAAIFYDLLLVAAIWMIGVTIDTLVRQSMQGNLDGSHVLLWLWWVLSPLAFFGWFWTHGGQTLGMRAWRIQVVNAHSEAITWRQASLRYLAAILSWGLAGAGYLWMLFDRDHCSLHDRLSGTYLVKTRKRSKR